jgi:hypothetical protein
MLFYVRSVQSVIRKTIENQSMKRRLVGWCEMAASLLIESAVELGKGN